MVFSLCFILTRVSCLPLLTPIWLSTHLILSLNSSRDLSMITLQSGMLWLVSLFLKLCLLMHSCHTFNLQWDGVFHGSKERWTWNGEMTDTSPKKLPWLNTKRSGLAVNTLCTSKILDFCLLFSYLACMVLECHSSSQLLLSTSVTNGSVRELWLSTRLDFHQP